MTKFWRWLKNVFVNASIGLNFYLLLWFCLAVMRFFRYETLQTTPMLRVFFAYMIGIEMYETWTLMLMVYSVIIITLVSSFLIRDEKKCKEQLKAFLGIILLSGLTVFLTMVFVTKEIRSSVFIVHIVLCAILSLPLFFLQRNSWLRARILFNLLLLAFLTAFYSLAVCVLVL